MKTQVVIIGGGVTGTGLARDLALRGVSCVLVERGDINAGASGGNHGLLHSGARYVARDAEAAAECCIEGALIKRLAPHCVQDTGGLFVAVAGDSENYVADFPGLCSKSGIETKALDIGQALEMEPVLSDRIVAAYEVFDASIDPFKLSLENMAHARQLGAIFLRHARVTGFVKKGRRLLAVTVASGPEQPGLTIEADEIVNASGAWAGEVAAMAGAHISMVYSQGSLLVTQSRLAYRVINRLRPPTDADILVPGGTVSILGTTSVRIATPDENRPSIAEVDHIIEQGSAMVPELARTRYIRAYSGVRPLVCGSGATDDRCVSRGFTLLDHLGDGLENFITITGGKLTTFRLMAEKTADLVCERLGVDAPCLTSIEPLPCTTDGRWTEPGLAPRVWIKNPAPQDPLLCECEMVPASAVDSIVARIRQAGGRAGLLAVALRSRIGKGPCQGAFCSLRVAAHLYETGVIDDATGLGQLADFLDERWRGLHPLMWETAMMQAELQEAVHCGLFGLELNPSAGNGHPIFAAAGR